MFGELFPLLIFLDQDFMGNQIDFIAKIAHISLFDHIYFRKSKNYLLDNQLKNYQTHVRYQLVMHLERVGCSRGLSKHFAYEQNPREKQLSRAKYHEWRKLTLSLAHDDIYYL